MKIKFIAFIVFLCSSLLSASAIQIQSGWQLLGATNDMDPAIFDDTCVEYVLKYDATTAQWQVHIANNKSYSHSNPEITSLNKGEGYWIKGSEACSVDVENGFSDGNISIKKGWQLLGAELDMESTLFDGSCVDYIWKYDAAAKEWQIHIANGELYSYSNAEISGFSKGEGYWVKASDDCTVSLSKEAVAEDTMSTQLSDPEFVTSNLNSYVIEKINTISGETTNAKVNVGATSDNGKTWLPNNSTFKTTDQIYVYGVLKVDTADINKSIEVAVAVRSIVDGISSFSYKNDSDVWEIWDLTPQGLGSFMHIEKADKENVVKMAKISDLPAGEYRFYLAYYVKGNKDRMIYTAKAFKIIIVE